MGKEYLLPRPTGPTTTLVLSDIHSQFAHVKALSLALNHFKLVPMEKRRIILLGDILDFKFMYAKSEEFRFNFKHGRWDYFIDNCRVEAEWFDQFYGLIRELVLDPEHIKMVEGNHEERLRRPNFMAKVPVNLMQNFNLRYLLKAQERKLQVIDYNDFYHLPVGGGLRFAHGAYAGVNVLKKHYLTNPVPMVLGHTHEIGYFCPKTDGEGETRLYTNTPCLCTKEAGDYMRKRPDNWCLGFTLASTHEDTIDVTIKRISDGKLFLDSGEVFIA